MEKFTEHSIIEKLKKSICDFWKGEEFDDKCRFPGAQPVSIELKDIDTIKKNRYVCCVKYDGERFFMILTKINGVNYSFLVDRNMTFFKIKNSFKDYAYQKGCIFDGELIENKFIIHDSIQCMGINVKITDFDNRWKKCNSVLVNFLENPDIFLKTFFPMNRFKDLVQYMQTINFKNDGIVFYPMDEQIGYKTQMNFFKWKPPGHHTIDFLTNQKEDKCQLITWSKGKENVYENIPLENVMKLDNYKPNCVIEFNTKITFNDEIEFVPIKVRIDKPKGNNLYTVRKTILNVRENIDLNKLITEFCE